MGRDRHAHRAVGDRRCARCTASIHPTEKPVEHPGSTHPLRLPAGRTVLDPFAGSGSTAAAARMSGRKAVLIEADERYCEAIVRRLQQDVLPLEAI
jgi:site-specific DNA-methyltransferase (adenine-specific)